MFDVAIKISFSTAYIVRVEQFVSEHLAAVGALFDKIFAQNYLHKFKYKSRTST